MRAVTYYLFLLAENGTVSPITSTDTNSIRMVFFFTSVVDGREWSLYMGRDKMENEDLLR